MGIDQEKAQVAFKEEVMPGLLVLLGVGAFVVMAFANSRSTTPPIHLYPGTPGQKPQPQKPPVPVPVRPADPPAPTLTLIPRGRYMTPFERFVLRDYIEDRVFDYAKLWFGRPASSFAQLSDPSTGVTTEALTTKNGIYFRFPNHEMNSAPDFALLAHELVHAGQFLDNAPVPHDEVPAYQTQLSVLQTLAPIAQLRTDFSMNRNA